MKVLSLFFACLIVILSNSLCYVQAGDFTITAADPATLNESGSFSGLISCVKDKNETNAYCGSSSNYAVKLALDPPAFVSEIGTDDTCFSVALYETDTLTRLFYNDDGVIKYTDDFTDGTAVDKTAASSYTIDIKGRMAIDTTNKIIYVSDFATSGDGHVLKITNIDSTPIFIADVITTQLNPCDLILANNDLYVAFTGSPGTVSRVPSPSSSSAEPSKTLAFTGSGKSIGVFRCFHQIGNFLYVFTDSNGKFVKLSIGSTDSDFTEVETSASADGSTSSLATVEFIVLPDSKHILVTAIDSKMYLFDVSTMTYHDTVLGAPPSAYSGAATAKGDLVVGTKTSTSADRLYHYKLTEPSSSSSSSLTSDQKMSIGIGIGVGVPFVALFVLAVVCGSRSSSSSCDDHQKDVNDKNNNAPDDEGVDGEKEMKEHQNV